MTSSERLAIVHVVDDGERGGVEERRPGSAKENVFDGYDNRGGQMAVVVFVVVTVVTVVTEVRKRKAKSRAPVGRVISSVRLCTSGKRASETYQHKLLKAQVELACTNPRFSPAAREFLHLSAMSMFTWVMGDLSPSGLDVEWLGRPRVYPHP